MCRACLHLSLLYREQGIKRDEAVKLELQAEELLEKFGHYAAKSVRETKDKLMIFDDLQPTFLGRYTGQKLLKHLQTSPEFKQASIS